MKTLILPVISIMLINFQLNSQITTSTFENRVDRNTGGSPFSIDVADLDGDSKPDMAVVNNSSSNVSVYLNTSSLGNLGLCSFDNKVDFATGGAPRTVRIGDIDGDAKPDLVVVNSSGNTFSVLQNTCTLGNISFLSKIDFNTGNYPASLALGDLNNDSKLDIVVAEYNDNAFSVFINTSTVGSVSFSGPVTFTTASGPQDVAIGELSGAGRPEIVISNIGAAQVSVYENLYVAGSFGAGSLATAITCTTQNSPDWLELVNIDNDADLDILVTEFNNTNPGFSVLENTTSGSMTFAGSHFATGSYPIGISAADIDNDNLPDIAVAVSASDNITVFRNTTGAGISFTSGVNFSTGSSSFPQDVILADIDGDTKPDISTVNNNNSKISQFRNTTATSSFAQYVDFTASTSPFSVDAGDLDGDNMADIVVANYGGNTISMYNNIGVVGSITKCSFAAKTDFTVGPNPRTVILVDLDNDSDSDMLSANEGSDDFSVLENLGALSFTNVLNVNVNDYPSALAVGDLNGDNLPDVAVSEYMNESFSIYINTTSSPGNITFASPVTFTLRGNPQFIAVSELNGTAPEEVVVSLIDLDSIQVFRNVYSGGTFTVNSLSSPLSLGTPDGPDWLDIEDIDGGGDKDIVVTHFNNTAPGFSAFRNTHAGASLSFGSIQSYSTGNFPIGIKIEDIDGDGRRDVAVAVTSSEVISVFPNNGSSGTISFSSKVDFNCPAGSVPQAIVFADLDGTGDGRPDMAVANNGNSSLSVYRNKSIMGTISLRNASMTSIDSKGQLTDNVIVYPNPSEHDLNLSFYFGKNSFIDVDLFDINGKHVYHLSAKQTEESQQQTYNLKTDHLTAGIYLLKLTIGDKQTTKKVVLTK